MLENYVLPVSSLDEMVEEKVKFDLWEGIKGLLESG